MITKDVDFTPTYDMIKTKRYLMVQGASDEEKKNGIVHDGVFLRYIHVDNSWSETNLDFDSVGFDFFVSNVDAEHSTEIMPDVIYED